MSVLAYRNLEIEHKALVQSTRPEFERLPLQHERRYGQVAEAAHHFALAGVYVRSGNERFDAPPCPKKLVVRQANAMRKSTNAVHNRGPGHGPSHTVDLGAALTRIANLF